MSKAVVFIEHGDPEILQIVDIPPPRGVLASNSHAWATRADLSARLLSETRGCHRA
jgi:hypothetical protein